MRWKALLLDGGKIGSAAKRTLQDAFDDYESMESDGTVYGPLHGTE